MKDNPKVLPGILFDVKHTLYDNDRATACGLMDVLNYIASMGNEGLNVEASLTYMRETKDRLKSMDEYAGDVNKEKRTRETVEIFMRDFKINTKKIKQRDMELVFINGYFDNAFFHNDVLQTLPYLKTKYIMGINTCCSDEMREHLEQLSTMKYFGGRIVNRWAKDGNSIKTSLEQMGTDPEKTAMIGDILPDFRGAIENGLEPILLLRHPIDEEEIENHYEIYRIFEEQPERVITRLGEIIPIMKKIDKGKPISKKRF